MTICVCTKRPGRDVRQLACGRWLLVAAVLLASAARAEDWLFARGNLESTGIAPSAIASSPQELWRYEVEEGSFEATAVVNAGVIYIGDVDGTFHAIDLATGDAVWTKTFDDTGFLSAAAIDGDRLFVGDYNGVLRCLTLADGEEVWHAELKAEVMAGPLVSSDTVLVTTEAGTFTLHDRDSGEQTGEFVIDAPLRCSPTIVGGRAMLAGCDGKLHAIDIKAAKEVDAVEIDGPTGSTPAARGSMIYFGTEQGTFYAIDTAKSPPEIVWTFADPRRRQGIRTAASVTDALAVFGSQGKAVYAVDLTTGEPNWTFPTRTRVESSPLVSGKHVIAATQRGRLHLIDLESGEAVWDYEAGGNFVASPVVVDEKLIIGNTDGTLYCFGPMQDE